MKTLLSIYILTKYEVLRHKYCIFMTFHISKKKCRVQYGYCPYRRNPTTHAPTDNKIESQKTKR